MGLPHCIYHHVHSLNHCKWPTSSQSIVICRGPTVVMVLTKWNAIADWRRLMGPVDPEEAKLLSPDSIRARFGINILKNGVHGATNLYSVTESISAVFGEDAGEQ